jgi:hypothetical protein
VTAADRLVCRQHRCTGGEAGVSATGVVKRATLVSLVSYLST